MTNRKGAIVPNRLLALVAALLLALLPACKASAAAPSPEDIDNAIAQLGDAAFDVREKASKFLWSIGEDAAPALREALKSSDAEVVARAGEILDNFRYGLTPDTPKDLVELIRQYPASTVEQKNIIINRLFAQQQKGLPILIRLVNGENDASLRGLILDHLGTRGPEAPRIAIALGDLPVAEALLEKYASTRFQREYAAWLLLRGQLDAKIKQLAPAADKADAAETGVIVSYLYRAGGDLKSAQHYAQAAGDETLLAGLQAEAGEWKALADSFDADVDANLNIPNQLNRLTEAVALHRMAGDKDKFAAALDRLKKTFPPRPEDAWLLAKACFLIDHPEDAVNILVKHGRRDSAFEILAAQWRCDEALKLLDANAPALVNPDEDLRLRSAAAPLLWNLGEKDRARQLADAVEKLVTQAHGEPWKWAAVITMQAKLTLRDRAIDNCLTAVNQSGPNEPLGTFFQPLFPRQKLDGDLWWRTLARNIPRRTITRFSTASPRSTITKPHPKTWKPGPPSPASAPGSPSRPRVLSRPAA